VQVTDRQLCELPLNDGERVHRFWHDLVVLDHWQHLNLVDRIEWRRWDSLQECDVGNEIGKCYVPALNVLVGLELTGAGLGIALDNVGLRRYSNHIKKGQEHLAEEVVVLGISLYDHRHWYVPFFLEHILV
jgi:hypothetical protein